MRFARLATLAGAANLLAVGLCHPQSFAQTRQAATVPLSAAQERALKPKDAFQECNECPVMTVVPAGRFTMGSIEPFPFDNEVPLHTVTIARQFAVGQYVVTFDQWDACATNGGCRGFKPRDQDWGRGTRPVIYVDWNDAHDYISWLGKKTGQLYRLLSESEYEYATRAGTTTAYPWGNVIGTNNANCDGCGSHWHGQTAPVGSFAANSFGLHDMVGNVWEWVEDCHNKSYSDAPADGSPWTSGDCGFRLLRGGSWYDSPRHLHSAVRGGNYPFHRDNNIGFRVGRMLLTP